MCVATPSLHSQLTEGAFSGFQDFIKFTLERKVAEVEPSVGAAVMFAVLRYVTLRYVTLRYVTLRYVTL